VTSNFRRPCPSSKEFQGLRAKPKHLEHTKLLRATLTVDPSTRRIQSHSGSVPRIVGSMHHEEEMTERETNKGLASSHGPIVAKLVLADDDHPRHAQERQYALPRSCRRRTSARRQHDARTGSSLMAVATQEPDRNGRTYPASRTTQWNRFMMKIL